MGAVAVSDARGERVRGAARRAADAMREGHRLALRLSLALDASRATQAEDPMAAAQLASRVPFGSSIRQLVRHRPGRRRVGVARVLMGSQCRLDSLAFADAVGSLRFGSLPMTESPHALLLRQAAGAGRPLTDDELRASEYFAFGHQVIEVFGDYFGARDDVELLALMRNFVAWALDGSTRWTGNSGSRPEDGILVARVAGSDTYQVMDGHHRVAIAILHGETDVLAHRTWLSTETPLQARLRGRARGVRRSRDLEQPLPARELSRWTVHENCEDRLVRLLRATASLDALPGARRYLDVGAGDGWYLAALRARGWEVCGLEAAPGHGEVAAAVHGLGPEALLVGPLDDALLALDGAYGLVTCRRLSALLAARDAAAGDALLAALDARTAHVLVVEADVGDDALARRVLSATSLRRSVDLGVSRDPAPDAPAVRLLAFHR